MSKTLNRVIIAVLVLPVFTWLILYKNSLPFLIFGAVALLAALYEAYDMIDKKGIKVYTPLGLVASGVVFYFLIFHNGTGNVLEILKGNNPKLNFEEGYFFTSGLLIMALFITVIISREAKNFERAAYTLAPMLYITTLGAFALNLFFFDSGRWYFFLLMLMTWVYDGGAYFAGSYFGKHKLIPELSPGKTVEGLIGGIVGNLIVSPIIFYTVLQPNHADIRIQDVMILAVLMSVFGQAGDIAASTFKRFTGVKNSSKFFGEHGGFLDKADSAIFNAPILYLYIRLFL